MTICVDFDGTIVSHNYPYIGADIGAIPVLKRLQDQYKLILYTMRSGPQLAEAVKYCKEKGIHLHAVNNNPSQSKWTKSPKIYGNYYIDDAAIGTPLKFDNTISNRPFVDWIEMAKLLVDLGLIK